MSEKAVVCRARSQRAIDETRDEAQAEPIRAAGASIEQLLAETKLPFAQAARELDHSAGAVTRWAFDGVLRRSCNGIRRRVWLEHFRIAGRLYTTREALARFIAALGSAEPSSGAGAAPTARTPAQRRAAVAEANKLAEALGA